MNATASLGKKLALSSALAGAALSAPFAASAHASSPTPKKLKIDSTQLLHIGSRGDAVKTLQTILNQKNFYQASIDGIYGQHTRSAVIRYQQAHGLRVDGIAGPVTIGSLSAVEGRYVPSQNLLSIGDRGHEVRLVQSKLKSLGYYTYNVDGIFGPITRDAVKHFQAASHLKIDGIVGPHTRKALFDHPEPAQTPPTETLSASTSNSSSASINNDPSSDSGLIAFAKELIGVPYQWGGTTPGGFDCSGFVDYVFQNIGVNLPRTTSSLWNYGVPVDQPQTGDLVFFETYKAGPSHVGIYLGDVRFVHADSDSGVMISSMNLNYWNNHFIGAERIVQN
ncbi:MAG TPA: peptidoglycan-binding protein [Bacillales bacterium]|nr:peptidoglycan-binding protein [Bacillales bacterium]